MSEYSRRILLGAVVAAVVGVSLVVGIAYLPLANIIGPSTTSTSPEGTTSTISTHGMTTISYTTAYPTIAETTNSTLGLKLQLSINSTTFFPGQGISINVTEYNTLPTTNNVSASKNWPIKGLYLDACASENFGDFPIGINVYRGYFSQKNISVASQNDTIRFVENLFAECPRSANTAFYVFRPNSDYLSSYGNCSFSGVGYCSMPVSYAEEFNGSWSGGGPPSTPPPKLTNLTQGIYTIVGGDEWGQLVLLYFEVAPKFMFTASAATTNNGSISTYETSIACIISSEPTGFYLHVITDGTPQPVEGAKLTATPVSECDGVNSTLTNEQASFITNSSGWATISMPSVPSGPYFLVFNVEYSNSTYSFSKTFDVYWQPEQGTFVTLSIPSGTVSIIYRFPVGCNGACYYMNIPQVITIAQSYPNITYTIQLSTNNTLVPSNDITNITLLTSPSNRTQIVRFYVTKPSYVFASPSYEIIQNSNSSSFYLSYQNGTFIPTAFDKTGNLLYTTLEVQGWIEVNSVPA